LDVQGTVRDLGELVNGNVGIGTSFVNGAGEGALTVMNGNVGIGTWLPSSAFQVVGQGLLLVTNNIGIGTALPLQNLHVVGNAFVTNNIGIGSSAPSQALDVTGTARATAFIGNGSCSYLYKCVGGVDAGVIQTSACNLCPSGSCTQMNGCF
jgi:hypothetical protein